MRMCKYCGEEKPEEEFNSTNQCKVCRLKQNRAYQHRPEVREKRRAYSNRPEVKEKRKVYQSRPEVKAKRKAYRQRPKVKEKRKEALKEWYRKRSLKLKLLEENHSLMTFMGLDPS